MQDRAARIGQQRIKIQDAVRADVILLPDLPALCKDRGHFVIVVRADRLLHIRKLLVKLEIRLHDLIDHIAEQRGSAELHPERRMVAPSVDVKPPERDDRADTDRHAADKHKELPALFLLTTSLYMSHSFRIAEHRVQQDIAVHLAFDDWHPECFLQFPTGFVIKEHIVMPQAGFRQQHGTAEVAVFELIL